MKYILYRSFGDLDKDIKKHELVAVETGRNIDDVTDALIKAVADDLAGMAEYEHCEKQRPMHRSRSKTFGRCDAISTR